ncbi:hypothetical protein ON010_g5840 [Phytophthora cinnamomi]|nr:hypothetical protein ON010_g5840 [Phytophthora cinnamomi]
MFRSPAAIWIVQSRKSQRVRRIVQHLARQIELRMTLVELDEPPPDQQGELLIVDGGGEHQRRFAQHCELHVTAHRRVGVVTTGFQVVQHVHETAGSWRALPVQKLLQHGAASGVLRREPLEEAGECVARIFELRELVQQQPCLGPRGRRCHLRLNGSNRPKVGLTMSMWHAPGIRLGIYTRAFGYGCGVPDSAK